MRTVGNKWEEPLIKMMSALFFWDISMLLLSLDFRYHVSLKRTYNPMKNWVETETENSQHTNLKWLKDI